MTGDAPARTLPAAWIAVLGIVFAALVASLFLLVSADHLPARFVDVERTRLVRTGSGTRLVLVLRQAPARGQLVHAVRPAEGDTPLVVEVRLSAAVEAATEVEGQEPGLRTLEIDLPAVSRVRVLDLRFGRSEAVDVELGDGP